MTAPSKEPLVSFTSVPPAHVIEAVLADVLLQTKATFDTVWTNTSSKLNKVETLTAAYIVARAEVEECLTLFENVQPETLRPKHRQAVECLELFQTLLEKTDLVAIKPKRSHHKAVITTAKDFVKFFTTYHLVLHEDTPAKDRTELVGEFKGYAL
tara:strand:- start:197 stop:661 length:465 start_codon:yes stop_codon:yes gene_type:complete